MTTKHYEVHLNIGGVFIVDVEADDKESAIEKAREELQDSITLDGVEKYTPDASAEPITIEG